MPRVQNSDIGITYDRRGEGRPVVLVHPILCRREYWEIHREEFSAGHETIAYDCRGHGESDRPDTPFTIDDHIEDLRTLIEELDLQQATVIGYSMGAYVAAGLICRYPGAASAAVLASCKVAGKRASSAAHIGIGDLRHGGDALDQVSTKVFHREPDPVHVAYLRLLARDMTPAQVELAIGSAGGFDLSEDLPRCEVPTLVLHGRDDVMNPVSEAERLAGLLPESRLVTAPDCGHELPMEVPDLFRREVLEFLA